MFNSGKEIFYTLVGNIDINFCMAFVCNDCIKCFLKKFNFIFSYSDEEIGVYDDDDVTPVAAPVPPAPAARLAGQVARGPEAPGHGRRAATRGRRAAARGPGGGNRGAPMVIETPMF